jgi:hypothetical protein
MTPAENKLRTLAGLNSTLQAALGSNPFRWCDRALTQGYLPKTRGAMAPCGGTSSVSNRRISTIPMYRQSGLGELEQIRFQIDVLDLDPDTCKQTAFAVIQFLGTVNLVTMQQLSSPPTTPNQFPSFLSNMRSGIEPQPGVVVYVESVDAVCYNSTAN